MNNISLIGRLTREPEMRKTGEGLSICTFTLAIDDTHSREDRADFIRVTCFGSQGDNCEKYLRKGFLAGVSGRLRSDQYTDADGNKRYPVDVVADRVMFLQWPEKEKESVETETETETETEIETETAETA